MVTAGGFGFGLALVVVTGAVVVDVVVDVVVSEV
ncbi:hypothetical protein EV186_1031000 [Labedaea rhizosphaerae]|uniref:Uncharacterized protein n=1 Tax=Labedaea rhizosphaerae TaxID=598644 RepID=A0A4R6SDK0_LABRH|nr:hypothetical protein EV186_1031000 [Labedaea rhizosphaerae]